MISIVTAHWHTPEFLKLLVASVRKFTVLPYEIVIVDNSNDAPFASEGDITVLVPPKSLPHGLALDYGIEKANGEYVLVMDSDAHILREGWDTELVEKLKDVQLVGAKGGDLKPFRPCTMFFRRDFFLNGKFTFCPTWVEDYKGGRMQLDVGVMFCLRLLHDSKKILGLPWCHSIYDAVWGDTYALNGLPTFYHNWYGSRFHSTDTIDGLSKKDFEKARASLFEQVKDIYASVK